MNKPRSTESAWPGILWIGWCVLLFVVVLGGGQRAFESWVILPACQRACAEHASTFERLRVGSRSAPSACVCIDKTAITTGLVDVGVFLSFVVFLPACALPFALWGLHDRRKRATRGGER